MLHALWDRLSLTPLLLISVSASVVALHACLLPLANWGVDEYLFFAIFREEGWGGYFGRVLAWSPRPVSELILFAMSRVTGMAGSPLVAPTLGVVWALCILFLCAASRVAGFGWHPGLVFAALLLLGGKPGEIWFWPAAAISYLPTIFAMAAAGLLLAGPQRDGTVAAFLFVALMVCAGSSEIGACFVLAFGLGFLGLRAVEARTGRALATVPSWPIAVPVVFAILVAWLLMQNRLGADVERFANAPPPAGLLDSLRLAVTEGIPRDLAAALPVLAAIAAGAIGLPGPGLAPARRALAAVFVLALGAASFVALVSAYGQFGIYCCGRHIGMRLDMLIMAMLVGLAFLRSRPGFVSRVPHHGFVVLPAVMVALLLTRAPGFAHDFAGIGAAQRARAATWDQARSRDEPMRFHNPPRTRLVNTFMLPPGLHRRAAPTGDPAGRYRVLPADAHAQAVLRYFDRQALRVE